jgi:hypothetical protein
LGYSDVVDNEVTLTLGNHLPNLVLDRLEDGFGRFDSSAGRCANVELDLSSVDGGKEIAAGRHQHNASQRQDQDGGDRDNEPPRKQKREHVDVTFAQPLEAALESAVQAGKPASRAARFATVLALEQQADHDRRQRPRQAVGSEHCEHDGEPKRREQELGRSLEEHHRREHAAYGERRYQGRDRDAGGAVKSCRGQAHSFFGAQPVGVLDGHR